MNKTVIASIIGLISVALIGLIAVQIHWVDNAMELKEARFKQTVNEALNAVVARLEKNEMASAIADKLDSIGKAQHIVLAGRDSAAFVWSAGDTIPLQSTYLFVDTLRTDQEGTFISIERRAGGDSTQSIAATRQVFADFQNFGKDSAGRIRIEINTSVADSGVFDIQAFEDIDVIEDIQKADSGKTAALVAAIPKFAAPRYSADVTVREGLNEWHEIVNKHPARVQNKIAMFSTVSAQLLREIVSVRKSFEDRVDIKTLGSLLETELAQRGIETPYRYHVAKTPDARQVATFEQQAGVQPMTVALFPNDIVGEQHFLHVYFPEQGAYIFFSMWLVLASSFGFILIIIFSFGFTVVSLYRQKKLSDVKTDFINNMTHEFKTPIATISLASEALKDPQIALDESRLQRFANAIYNENKRLESQVERVLQAAVLDRGEYRLSLAEVDVHRVAEKALGSIALQVESRQGRISRELQAGHHRVTADEMHLSNILYNLLDNANKYSESAPEIRLATRNVAKGIVIDVEDKGIGMSKEAQRKIFDKFYRVATGNIHDVKGFGLGLSYVKSIVEAHGGTVSVRSEAEAGSTFSVFIPFEQTHGEER